MRMLPTGGKLESGNTEYVLQCRHCSGKFTWNIVRGFGHCWSCKQVVTGWKAFYKQFGDGTEQAPTIEPGLRQETDELEPAWEQTSYEPAGEYLFSRGVNKQLAQEVGIMYRDNRIYIPVTSQVAGDAPFWMHRSILPDSHGWMAPPVTPKSAYWFGYPQYWRCYQADKDIRGAGCPLLLVEGIFDVLTPGLYGNAVALLGSQLSAVLEAYIGHVHPEVWLWLDNDDAGIEGSYKIYKQLLNLGVKVRNVPYEGEFQDYKDPSAFSPRDASEYLDRCGFFDA